MMEPAFRLEFGKLQDKIPPMSVRSLEGNMPGLKPPKLGKTTGFNQQN
jgi:hypothetical protein